MVIIIFALIRQPYIFFFLYYPLILSITLFVTSNSSGMSQSGSIPVCCWYLEQNVFLLQ